MAEPYLGQIQAFGFDFAPRGWAKCDGQLLPIAQNSALFSLLGTTYGGDGRTTFALPDLRGRVSLHQGQGPGLSSRRIGEKGGGETHTLIAQEIPSHLHGVEPAAAAFEGDKPSPTGNFPAEMPNAYGTPANAKMGSFNTGNTGGSGPHNNMQPYLVINWCIATQGIFPPRN